MPTANMGMTLPTEDGSEDTWDTLLNAALEVVDAHDHSSGNGVLIPTAGLGIDANLPFGGFAATGLLAVDFNAVAAASVSSFAMALFANSADNELYWRTSGGVNVQLTDGNSLNAALLGGFTGDYGAGDEEAEFTSGTGIYNFLALATTRGYIDCADIRLFEATAGITNAVKIKSPAALAASYTLTFPGALPGSTQIPKVEADGDIAFTGAAEHSGNLTQTGTLTVTGATTLQSTLGVTGAATLSSTLGVTGAATLSSTLGVTGLITASAGLTCAVDQNVTVSGTGLYKRPGRIRHIPGCMGVLTAGTETIADTTGNHGLTAAGSILVVPIPMDEGEQLTQVQARVQEAAAGDTIDMKVWRIDASNDNGAATRTQLGATASSAGATTRETLTVGSLTETVGTQFYAYIVEFTLSAFSAGATIEGVTATVGVP